MPQMGLFCGQKWCLRGAVLAPLFFFEWIFSGWATRPHITCTKQAQVMYGFVEPPLRVIPEHLTQRSKEQAVE